MKSLKLFKPTLATTLAMVLASLLSVPPAQAGYTVTLQQVGPDVVATGSGAIDLRGLSFTNSGSIDPVLIPSSSGAEIWTGPTSSSIDYYSGLSGPTSFGGGYQNVWYASSGSGNMVGISSGYHSFSGINPHYIGQLFVPKGYVSGTALSDTATYSGQTLATLGVTPGTYVWTWGTGGANQNFTLQILSATHITNISTRASVQTGDRVTIAGFIVSGTDPKPVLIRGLGPTLATFNVSGSLQDPTLELYNAATSIATNDDWQQAANAGQIPIELRPPDPRESAILATLQPGNYTVITAGKNGTTGIGLAEVYDMNTATLSQLTNVSTRGFVGTDQNVMIAGFIASGNTQVVVRGLGPTLTQFGLSGTLADPMVTLVDSNGNVLQTNNNWKDTQQAAITATGKAPPNDLEAAILATVSAGNYTAILSGNGGGTGIGLVEVYKSPL